MTGTLAVASLNSYSDRNFDPKMLRRGADEKIDPKIESCVAITH